MPLHLLGKKSWNVYNPANIARVKADEAAAAAREAAQEQRDQEIDTARRAAILRGQTPPPLPNEPADEKESRRRERDKGDAVHDRKRRRLAGEDDTARDIRLASSLTGLRDECIDQKRVVKLRSTASDAPLTDHAGNIDLFPIDMKETLKRQKNAEAEREKKKKDQALEDQYTMRFSNAAGKSGLDQPWYASTQKPVPSDEATIKDLEYAGFGDKNVWGDEDPRRQEREKARITSSDPFAAMQKAQVQLRKVKEERKKGLKEREKELRELRAAQEREERRSRHHERKRSRRNEDHHERHASTKSEQKHRRRSQSWSHNDCEGGLSKPRERKRERSGSRDRDQHRESNLCHSSHHRRSGLDRLVD